MNTTEIINQILLGGLLGILGQGIRVVVGIKKLSGANAAKRLNNEETDEFSPARLLLSIFIGFIAGAIALLIKGKTDSDAEKTQMIITIIAAGYSGADFIEGVFNTYIKKFNSAKIDQ
jgi:uncharacterized membrane protein YeaQ/YmgE (transglycosylase-associated protein family)